MARDARLLSVRRLLERWAPWLAGAVLLAGVGALVATRLDGGSSAGGSPAPAAASQQKVPLDPQARAVAREFVATAVARRNLARSWALAAPELRGDHTLAEWLTGSIPVVPYPAAKARASYAVQVSTADRAVLRVGFTPSAGSEAQPGDFLITLRRIGGRWLVASWAPRSVIGAHG